ncbi:MAG: hypothetical protein V3T84_05025 [Phycisphaerales bacterium]
MTIKISRRSFVTASPVAGVSTLFAIHALQADGGDEPSASVYDGFPSQDRALVRETVTVSHFGFGRVRELVEASPALAKANWDWGYGDWESALGAASHMGKRDIAEFLIEHGARPNIFSATMLGQLDVVKSFVAASPGVQRTPGPHGITLLTHAKHGGEPAAAVVAYLESLGDADIGQRNEPMTASEREAYVGVYAFGAGETDRLEISEHSRSQMLRIKRSGQPFGRAMFYLGSHEFHPTGAPSVRIRFALDGDQIASVTVADAAFSVTADRL